MVQNFVLSEEIQCYGVLFDAGSSSTKTSIYQYPCRKQKTFPLIEMSQTFNLPSSKPGISNLSENEFEQKFSEIFTTLNQKFDNLKQDKSKIPVILTATAGMRLLPKDQQEKRIQIIKDIFKNSGYLYQDDWVQVIDGKMEGSFLWITINYLMNKLDIGQDSNQVITTLDLGGASTQVTISNNLIIFNKFDLAIGLDQKYTMYSNSFLPYGNDQARNEIADKNLTQYIQDNVIFQQSPCYYKDYQKKLNDNLYIVGTGNITQCEQRIQNYFNMTKCIWEAVGQQCTIQDKYSPYLGNQQIYAASGFNYAASFLQLQDKAFQLKDFISQNIISSSKNWIQIKQENQKTPEDTLGNQFFLNLYAANLLKSAYKIKDETYINSPNDILGVTPTYAPGAFMYFLNQQLCKIESPLCQNMMFL